MLPTPSLQESFATSSIHTHGPEEPIIDRFVAEGKFSSFEQLKSTAAMRLV